MLNTSQGGLDKTCKKNCTASELEGFSEWLILAFLLRLLAAAQVLHAPHCAPSVTINLVGKFNEKMTWSKELHLQNVHSDKTLPSDGNG